MDLEAFADLLTPRGQRALAEAGELIGADPVAAATRLRRTYDAALTSAALTQAGLRERARAKFGADAERMYFTPHGLEQATRAEVAAHRAHRIATWPDPGTPVTQQDPHTPAASPDLATPATQQAPGTPAARHGPDAAATRREAGVPAAGGLRVVDACCGIGGDLLALARAGCIVTAVDTDPLTVAVARANAEAFGLAAEVCVADAASVRPEDHDVLFADPARRTSRGRTFDPMAYSPPWPVVLDLLARARRACLKVAPGIPYEFIPADAEAEWVSYKGEVKEATLWTGGAGGGRRATLLPGGHTLTATGTRAPVGPVGRYLYEPDGAAIRAHLVGEVAALVNGRLPDPMIAYITGDTAKDTPWAARYEINDVLPFSLKKLRAELRRRHVGNVTIKKRGSAIDIERLRTDLRLNGDNSAVIILTRILDKPSVLICNPSSAA
ncbi:class I SAM-dependent methyltransferase [Nonomuraea jiangxiensis]|uniref:Methyltransferase domain-containing protein n=1 Tax=Nonomuraea jiangxiensis TaxID=633440 RepID=A0A1G8G4S1_9ACTN|nr:class I SAM-dependent methyltransferase [Nonomuraea jiangxiensis]SDH89337.1 Methyltransferase domain-containing protein [Nonomuraea jiangxiensis]